MNVRGRPMALRALAVLAGALAAIPEPRRRVPRAEQLDPDAARRALDAIEASADLARRVVEQQTIYGTAALLETEDGFELLAPGDPRASIVLPEPAGAGGVSIAERGGRAERVLRSPDDPREEKGAAPSALGNERAAGGVREPGAAAGLAGVSASPRNAAYRAKHEAKLARRAARERARRGGS